MKKLIKTLKIFSFAIGISSYCYASDIDNDDLLDAYKHSLKPWEKVTQDFNPNFKRIFETIPPPFWPTLPHLYEWRKEEDGSVNLYKHESAPEHDFDFVLFGPDSGGRVNFLSRWDGVTYQSFAHTQSDTFDNKDARSYYPINQYGFKFKSLSYVRGHLIDFADTIGKSILYKKKDLRFSTNDPRNFIPEPPNSYWGLVLRRNLVADIRRSRGAYAQYMQYSTVPEITDYGTSIPNGVFLAEINTKSSSHRVYDIKWNNNIHTRRQGRMGLRTELREFIESDSFIPSPFVRDIIKEYQADELATLTLAHDKMPFDLAFKEKFKIKRTASYEVKTVNAKILESIYSIKKEDCDEEVESTLSRLMHHASFMDDNKYAHDFISLRNANYLLSLLRTAETVDRFDAIYDHLHQINSNQSEGHLRLETLFAEDSPYSTKDVILKKSSTKTFAQEYKGICSPDTIIEHLKRHNTVRIVDLTTHRAKTISKEIAKAIEKGEISEDILVEYRESPSKRWNIQPKFDEHDILARRLDL